MSPRAQGAVWCPCQTSSEFYPINPQMCQGSSWIQREGSADRESVSVGDYKKNWPQKRIGIRKLSRSHQSDSLYKYALCILCSHGSLLIEMGPRSSRLKHVTGRIYFSLSIWILSPVTILFCTPCHGFRVPDMDLPKPLVVWLSVWPLLGIISLLWCTFPP